MRNFHVMTNADKDQDLHVTKRIRDYLTRNGCRCGYEIVDRTPAEKSLHLHAGGLARGDGGPGPGRFPEGRRVQ